MPENYSYGCKCGEVKIRLTLPKKIERFRPRACDCEFCQRFGAAYISDPFGGVVVEAEARINKMTQGSKQATFWQCPSCSDMVAVTAMLEDGLKGAINAELISRYLKLRTPVTVSPRLLSEEGKIERWRSTWFRASLMGGSIVSCVPSSKG